MRKKLLYIILGLLVAMFIIVDGFSNIFENAFVDFDLSYRLEKVIEKIQ